jgi:hypothetical protein
MSDHRKQVELQRLWVELEWRRCAMDEVYFLQKYVFIPSEEDPRGRTKFELQTKTWGRPDWLTSFSRNG